MKCGNGIPEMRWYKRGLRGTRKAANGSWRVNNTRAAGKGRLAVEEGEHRAWKTCNSKEFSYNHRCEGSCCVMRRREVGGERKAGSVRS